MMLWFDRHRRLRDQMSAYIDGELDSPAAERLESHLAECERCRVELIQLRATVAGLRELPEVEPPRSFTLSPERVAAPRPRLPATPPLAVGARIAAAGLAAALAAVLVVDLGDIGGDGGVQEAEAPQTTMERLADEGGMEAATGAPAADEAEGAGGAGVGGEAPAPEPDAAETPSVPAEGEMDFMSREQPVEPPAAGPEEAEQPPAPPEGTPFPSIEELERAIAEAQEAAARKGGGGIDALTATEIGLAAALGVLVAASLALAFAGRKR